MAGTAVDYRGRDAEEKHLYPKVCNSQHPTWREGVVRWRKKEKIRVSGKKERENKGIGEK